MNLLLSFVSVETPFSQMGVQRYDFFLYFQIFLQYFSIFLQATFNRFSLETEYQALTKWGLYSD